MMKIRPQNNLIPYFRPAANQLPSTHQRQQDSNMHPRSGEWDAEAYRFGERHAYRHYVKADHKNHVYNAEYRMVSLSNEKGVIVDIYV